MWLMSDIQHFIETLYLLDELATAAFASVRFPENRLW